MGIYLNPTNTDFQRALNSEIYIDKSELIKYTNKVLCTEQQFLCVSRPRRFGKSMTANMLVAYYVAKKSYNIYRELPTGKGFVDLVFIPKRNSSMPPFLVELKVNQSMETAIDQIKNKNYLDCLNEYRGEIVLVGINYDKESKKHSCKIEKVLNGSR